jgi:RHS repeat-associated protein
MAVLLIGPLAIPPSAHAHSYKAAGSPHWPGGAACPAGQARVWRINSSNPWLTSEEVIADSPVRCEYNIANLGWGHCMYTTSFGISSGTVAQNTQYKATNHSVDATSPSTYQVYQSLCRSCGADEYVDTTTNTCKPKPGCSEGQQLPYCSSVSPRNDKQLGEGCPTREGNPINSATGNKSQRETDYVAASGGLTFVRSYNSKSTQNDVLGHSWRHNWQGRLARYDFQSNSYIVATRADGQSFYFTLTNGAWVNETDIKARLIETAEGFVLADGATGRETYDAQGRLLQVEAAGVNKFTLIYSGNVLTGVVDRFGRSLSFAYDANGRLQTLTDPAQVTTTYAYDAAGNLASVTYPGNEGRTYHYENASYPHALTGISDENGARYATWDYDSQGRAEASEHAGGADASTLAYNPDGTTTITNAFGLSRTRSYQLLQGTFKPSASTTPGQQCGENFAETGHDANGFVSSRKDFNGNITNYVNNARGLEESRTEAYGTPQARTITTQWHTTFRLPMQIDEPGRRTTYTYHPAGNRLTETITDTGTTESRITTWTYNTDGQVLTVDGPRTDIADVSAYAYYNDTTADHREGDLHTVTNAAGHVTEITAYDKHGNPLTIVDPNGVTTTLTYDPRQRLETRTVDGKTTTFDYDAAGQLGKATLPDGSFLDYTYDDAHRLTDIQDSARNRVHYTLDALGRQTQEETFDPSGVLTRRQSQVFDALGLLQQIKNAGGEVVSEYGYDAQGNRTSQTDAGNYETSFSPDALNRVWRVIDAAGGVTLYDFNALDQLTSVTDPKGLTTTYALNALGDVTLQVSPDTTATSYTYDAAGNRKTQTDARGIAVSYSYDALNRLTSIDYPGTNEDVVYSYDSPSQPYSKGRLTGVVEEGVTTTIQYNPRGTVESEARVIDARTYVTSYTYDDADRLLSITYPTGRVVNYARDSLGQLSAVWTDWGSGISGLAMNIDYMPFGPRKSFLYADGWGNETWSYDQNYQMTGRMGQGVKRTWVYDLRGNITRVDDLQDGNRSADYGYDGLGRMTTAVSGYGHLAYQYDDNGNREIEAIAAGGNSTTNSYTYATSSNRLASISGASNISFSYDAAGNVTQRGDLALAYGQAGRLREARRDGALVGEYRYYANGQRSRKLVYDVAGQVAATILFHYDHNGRLLAETTSAGQLIREYVWMDELPIAMIARPRPPATAPVAQGGVTNLLVTLGIVPPTTPATPQFELFYIHADQLGTPVAALHRTEQVPWWDGAQKPFGEIYYSSRDRVEQPLRFPGQYFDAETGLHQNWWRDYDPALGRYLQPDPLGLYGGDLSTYLYARDNPLIYTDPTGESAEVLGAAAAPKFPAPPPVLVGMASFAGGYMAGSWLYPHIEPLITPVVDYCLMDSDDETDENCEALYRSILRTCASLSGRKQFQCYEAARRSRDQCYQERGR